MIQAVEPKNSAQGVAWDLSDLYLNVDDPAITHDLTTAQERAQKFEATYRGKIDQPGGPDSHVLLSALIELESLFEQMDRPCIYASLVHAADSENPKHGALLSRSREQRTEINKHLIFFDLEWFKVSDEAVSSLLSQPELAKFRHYLEAKRAWKPHSLSEPEEKVTEDKSITGRAAFVRLFDEITSKLQTSFTHGEKHETLSLQGMLAKLYDPDREVRKAASAGLTQVLQQNAHLLTYIINTLVLDQQIDCRLRKFASPQDPRNLANEISAKVVEALMTATERYHPTFQRYYRLKKQLLGLEELWDYDRYAPLGEDLPDCDWPTARRIVEESYAVFSPQTGDIVRTFFDKRWIDAESRPGKRNGAFSSSAVPSAHPYILMTYLDRMRDVMTLAHELGHGVHQYLSRPIGYLQCDTPLTTAETASVFGEMLTFQRLQQLYPEPKVRLALLCSKIEDGFATVFRQVVLTRFEQSLYRAREQEGELTTARINELWMAANAPMHQGVVQLSENYAWWWSYIGHFIHSPFYCYAYAFGELLVLALVQLYRDQGPAFVPRYLELLAAGGSEAPHVLCARLGMDVNDPGFWELGLKLLDGMVTEAEKLAGELAQDAQSGTPVSE